MDTVISTLEERIAGSIGPFTPLGTPSNGSIKRLPQLTVLPAVHQTGSTHVVKLEGADGSRPLIVVAEGGTVSVEVVRHQDSGMRQILDVPPLYTKD